MAFSIIGHRPMMLTKRKKTMDKFIKSNGIASFIINLVMNTAGTSFLLWNENVLFLKEGNPVLLPNILGPVIVSAFLTTLGTFFLMTKKRKSGEIGLPIKASTQWFPTALVVGIVIALCFGLVAFIVLTFIQMGMDNLEIPKTTVIIISAAVGTLSGFVASFIAANRASILR